MFERLYNAVFWQQRFDDTWRHNSMFLKLPDVGWRWEKRIEEKRTYWREHGKRRQLSPKQAAYRAIEDIADTLSAEHDNNERMEETWIELAQALYYAACNTDWDGPYVPPQERLAARWQPYYEIYRARREAEKQDKEQRAREIQSHRFERSLINEAWQNLLSGNVSREVQAIWRHSEPPRKPAHSIATSAGVSVRDFVFWMVVLRDHGFMSENVVLDEHLYCNERAWLEKHEKLDERTKALLGKLGELMSP